MLEIEVKTPCPDAREVERKLVAMGARPLEEVAQTDIYFGHPCRYFAATDEALRVRGAGEDWELTYKGSKVDPETKTREEITCQVDDGDMVISLLTRLGFREAGRVRKRRTRFMLDRMEISIDRVEGLGDFVELEAKVEDLGLGKKMIAEKMATLGLYGSERRSYLEMLLEGDD